MIRRGGTRPTQAACKPRASGDDPVKPAKTKSSKSVNPARAGMILHGIRTGNAIMGKPRASGDDPDAVMRPEGEKK